MTTTTAPISDSAELLLGRLVEKSQISIDLCKDMKLEIANLASDFRSGQKETRDDLDRLRKEVADLQARVKENEIRAETRTSTVKERWSLKEAIWRNLGTLFAILVSGFVLYEKITVAAL